MFILKYCGKLKLTQLSFLHIFLFNANNWSNSIIKMEYKNINWNVISDIYWLGCFLNLNVMNVKYNSIITATPWKWNHISLHKVKYWMNTKQPQPRPILIIISIPQQPHKATPSFSIPEAFSVHCWCTHAFSLLSSLGICRHRKHHLAVWWMRIFLKYLWGWFQSVAITVHGWSEDADEEARQCKRKRNNF